MTHYPTQGLTEAQASIEAMTGVSELDARAAQAEKLHGGDYKAACQRIAQLEKAMSELEDQHADLQRLYGLVQGTAEVVASKALKIDDVEQIIQLNRQYGTDSATAAFVAGRVNKKRTDGRGGGIAKGESGSALKEWVFAEYCCRRPKTDPLKELVPLQN